MENFDHQFLTFQEEIPDISVEACGICISQSDTYAIGKNLNTDLNVYVTGLLHQKMYQTLLLYI